MNRKNRLRYDPLYRVIDITDEMGFVEGTFKKHFDRLKGINNLGIISEVLEMAKYSKYEHHSGITHQINCLLECISKNIIPPRHRPTLKLSAILLHTGHFPLTYSTERSLLIAANLDKRVKNYVKEKVQKVLRESKIRLRDQRKCLDSLFSLRRYKTLYKYFSALGVLDKWNGLKKKYKLGESKKKTIIQNMIDETSDGYKFLILADKADFVQRDALYFGTARIDISPKHLYTERNLLEPEPIFSVDEKDLLESNLRYLTGRFYENYEVCWFTRLYEKIVAGIIISVKFQLDWLKELDDLQFKRLVTENTGPKNKRIGLPPVWVGRARNLFRRDISFSLIFELQDISFEKQSGIDLEHKLLKKRPSKKGLLQYPFHEGILLDIGYNEESEYPVHPEHQSFSIRVFQDDSNRRFIELLKIIKQLSHYCSINHTGRIRKELCKQFSWTGSTRVNNDPVIKVIAQGIHNIELKDKKKGRFTERFLENIVKIKGFEKLWYNFENGVIWQHSIAQLKETNRMSDSYELIVRGILNFPVRLIQCKPAKDFTDEIYKQLLKDISHESDPGKKGHIFESLCLMNRLQNTEAQFRFLINGMIVIDPEKMKAKIDENEFDVIDLFINNRKKAECWIYACSITDDYKQKNENKLKKLAENIHKYYTNLIIGTKYAIPKDKLRNNWNPEYKGTGVGSWP